MVGVSVTTSNLSTDYSIQGKMLKCESLITMEEWERQPAEWVKQKMMRLLVDEMMKQNCIEFTMEKEHREMNMVRVRARIFVTPDSQVRLLRTKGNL